MYNVKIFVSYVEFGSQCHSIYNERDGREKCHCRDHSLDQVI